MTFNMHEKPLQCLVYLRVSSERFFSKQLAAPKVIEDTLFFLSDSRKVRLSLETFLIIHLAAAAKTDIISRLSW